ncbi:nuclear transcription factor Y subunit C-4-like [Dioscorea cayenensis subsp. rotundata]|uniref:Nuclear transcription factor Y subunit C-4-like n=1 Tax=Dioscorea cayennensis subsp. rotundata TaxID=55577 RepID=A0AB40ATP1_DIOCR|nr:nuclear transcription factor Y subunit C-4-like [Dioscorea cayenensis subsp. rotundata]
MDHSVNDPNSMYFPLPIHNPSPPRSVFPQAPVNYPSINQIRLPDLMSHSDLMRMEKQHMDLFWQSQKTRFENLQASDYKNHEFAKSRMKRLVKSSNSAQKVKAESPFILAKACELLIEDIARRSWLRTKNNRRRSLEKSDIINAMLDSKEHSFLIDKIITDSNQQNEGTSSQPGV